MPVSDLGVLLKNKRDELGLTLEEAEQQTRIRSRYLQALESGDWDALPPGVYTRGLLKTYARALGLSVNSVSRMYAKERPQEARLPEPQLISQPLVRQPRVSTEMMLATAGFAIAFILLGWLLVSQLSPMVNKAAERIANGGTPVAAPADRTQDPTPVSLGTEAAAPTTVSASPTPRPSPSPQPTATPADGLVVRVNALGNVWLRVISDGQVIFTDFMQEADTQTFEGKQVVNLKTGNAGGTDVTVNGQALGVLGSGGEVKTCEWQMREAGVIEMTGCDLPGTPKADNTPEATPEVPGATG